MVYDYSADVEVRQMINALIDKINDKRMSVIVYLDEGEHAPDRSVAGVVQPEALDDMMKRMGIAPKMSGCFLPGIDGKFARQMLEE